MSNLAYIGSHGFSDHITRAVFHNTGVTYVHKTFKIAELIELQHEKIYYPLIIKCTQGYHANALFIDNVKKTVVYIEPHAGANTQWYRDNINKVRPYFPDYIFYDFMNGPRIFQTRETRYPISCALWIILMGYLLINHSVEELQQIDDTDACMDNFCKYISQLVPTTHISDFPEHGINSLYSLNLKLQYEKSKYLSYVASIYFRLIMESISAREMNILNYFHREPDPKYKESLKDIPIIEPVRKWDILRDTFIYMCAQYSHVNIGPYLLYGVNPTTIALVCYNHTYIIRLGYYTLVNHLILERLYILENSLMYQNTKKSSGVHIHDI